MLLWVFWNKLFLLLWNDLWNVNLESKDYKTLSTHSLISLSSKFWYQLLTMNLSIIIKFETINNLFMWSQNNLQNENRDNINTWISWFYSLKSWSDDMWATAFDFHQGLHFSLIQNESYQQSSEKTKNNGEHVNKIFL